MSIYCLTSWSHTPFSSIFRFLGASKLPAFHARGRLKLHMFVASAPGLLGAGCLTYYLSNGFARGWYKTFAGGAGMTARNFALIALSALAATSASAQSIGTQRLPPDLAGLYRCVRNCAGTGPAQISQRGWDLYLTNENGQTAQAWIDWPGHIKSQSWDDCAVYSPDGFTIQFNRGAVWVLVDPMMGGGWKQW